MFTEKYLLEPAAKRQTSNATKDLSETMWKATTFTVSVYKEEMSKQIKSAEEARVQEALMCMRQESVQDDIRWLSMC